MLDHGDASKSNDEIKEALKFIELWSDTCPRIDPILGPHAAYTCSDKLLKTCAQEARKLSVMLHMHFAENPYELTVMKQRTGTTTAQHLEKLDFFRSNRIIGAHSLFLTDKDLHLLKKHDFHAVACIPGKMNRGHGIVDLTRLMDAGLNVCLGTDGSASDNLDLLAGMKIAHISQNYLHKQVCSLSPETMIKMATRNGAKALKWKTGRLSPGYLADFIMIDTQKVHLRPLMTKPVSNVMFNVVYYAMGSDVDTVVIEGKVIMREKKLLTIDESQILNHLQQKAQALWEQASP
jgi:5-methylthioadenosine/S-adenosylhomocysteine deaminase